MTQFTRIGVLGAGAWGTALAASLYAKADDETPDIPVWALEEEVAADIENLRFEFGCIAKFLYL